MPLYDARRTTYSHDSFGPKPVGDGIPLDAGGNPPPLPPTPPASNYKPRYHSFASRAYYAPLPPPPVREPELVALWDYCQPGRALIPVARTNLGRSNRPQPYGWANGQIIVAWDNVPRDDSGRPLNQSDILAMFERYSEADSFIAKEKQKLKAQAHLNARAKLAKAVKL